MKSISDDTTVLPLIIEPLTGRSPWRVGSQWGQPIIETFHSGDWDKDWGWSKHDGATQAFLKATGATR